MPDLVGLMGQRARATADQYVSLIMECQVLLRARSRAMGYGRMGISEGVSKGPPSSRL